MPDFTSFNDMILKDGIIFLYIVFILKYNIPQRLHTPLMAIALKIHNLA